MKYLAYYDTAENKAENRGFVLSATNKMDYLCSVLQRLGYSVEIISASGTNNRKACKGKNVHLSDQITLKLFPSIGQGALPKRIFGRFLMRMRLFFYLLFKVRRGEKIMVYHSLGYAETVALARKIKKFHLILEVEEIYSDVNECAWDRMREHHVFRAADAFLFPTELLNETVNKDNRPFVIVHGTYQPELDRGVKRNDGKIHVLYAGTLDPRKGGAVASVTAAAHLPENYHIHILGFGSEEQKQVLRKVIEENCGSGHATVTYDGLLSGEDFIRFVQSCDIGLSTQNPDATFNATSFPSKILTYMANGLHVVSIRIPAIETSAVGEYMNYYDEQTPEKIAKAIQSVMRSDHCNGRRCLLNLDQELKKQLQTLLEE